MVTRPDAVEKVHAAFLEVGCDVVETNSFNGTPVDFAEYDIGDKAYDMNVLAARLAKRVAADYSTPTKPRWVAGSMGPGRKLPTLGHISFSELREAYKVQVAGFTRWRRRPSNRRDLSGSTADKSCAIRDLRSLR